MSKEQMEAAAFRHFAAAYPHEAAEHNWLDFVTLCQEKNPELTEAAIRELLRNTDVEAHPQ